VGCCKRAKANCQEKLKRREVESHKDWPWRQRGLIPQKSLGTKKKYQGRRRTGKMCISPEPIKIPSTNNKAKGRKEVGKVWLVKEKKEDKRESRQEKGIKLRP